MAAPTAHDPSQVDNLNSGQLDPVTNALAQPAESYKNAQDVEMQWAVKAYHHAETYFNLISSLEPMLLRLTKSDDLIYETFRKEFPDMKVDVLDQNTMKSKEGKEKWRPFCELFKDMVDEYNFASLIRMNCTFDYSEENSFVVPKIQFLALEISRNREGLNSGLRDKYCKGKSSINS